MTSHAQPSFATPRTSERKTLGKAAAKIAKLLGQELLPWQRQVLDVALEVDEGGRFIYRDVILTVPRQQGKTFLLLVLILTRALLEPRSNIIFAAQSALDAKKKLDGDWAPLIEASLLDSQMTVRHAPGREGLAFVNGARMGIAASTQKAGHGETVDLAIVDEAFAYQDARLEQALKPAQMTRPNSQFWVCSTAGTPNRSPYLLDRVETGRAAVEAGITRDIAFFEYSAPEGADPADPETWRACMPALGFTVTEDAVRAAQLSLGRNEFARGYLNRWVSSMGESIISLEHWQALIDLDAPRPERVVLGVDIAPKGSSAAIVAVGKVGDDLHAAVLEHGPGTDWLVAALKQLKVELDGPYVLLDVKACAALLPELQTAVGSQKLIELSTAEIPPSCAFFLRLTKEGHLHHRGELELLTAIDGAATRTLGDGFAWSRRASGTDITPLVALTFAVSFWLGSWGLNLPEIPAIEDEAA
jgi:phage terminase large subunit-like protein